MKTGDQKEREVEGENKTKMGRQGTTVPQVTDETNMAVAPEREMEGDAHATAFSGQKHILRIQ